MGSIAYRLLGLVLLCSGAIAALRNGIHRHPNGTGFIHQKLHRHDHLRARLGARAGTDPLSLDNARNAYYVQGLQNPRFDAFGIN
jgi:hypothetical protein